jgi:hypothetical protein
MRVTITLSAHHADTLHVERREDPGGELGRAAAIEQDEELVQVDGLVLRQPGRERRVEAGRHQPPAAPLAEGAAGRAGDRLWLCPPHHPVSVA